MAGPHFQSRLAELSQFGRIREKLHTTQLLVLRAQELQKDGTNETYTTIHTTISNTRLELSAAIAMPSFETPPPPQSAHYQHIVVEGHPYDRGVSHGTQVREKILTNIAYYKLPGKLPDW
jgi:hypothetical protein